VSSVPYEMDGIRLPYIQPIKGDSSKDTEKLSRSPPVVADDLRWKNPACLTRRSLWLYLVSMSLTPRKAFCGPKIYRHRW
jgi:hypothetical protein